MATGHRRLMAQATCIYDGECGFCQRSVLLARGLVEDKVDFQPSQEVAHRYPEISPDAFERAVQFVDEDDQISEGAEAVFRCLQRARGLGWLLLLYLRLPLFQRGADLGYAAVAKNRGFFSRAIAWLVGPRIQLHALTRVRWLILRLMGLIYILAFASLLPQLRGLIGSEGILPFDRLLHQTEQTGGGWAELPTLLWLAPTDQGLMALCWLGLSAGFLLLTNRLARLAAVLCWLSYLSIYTVAQNFLWLQWDLLLLEAGFLTLLLAARARGPGLAGQHPPRWITLFLFRCLAFRLLLSSGLVKLLSGDPTWAHRSALMTHFETQPLPNVGAWIAHQLPEGVLVAAAGLTLLLETIIPLLFFAPRRFRCGAALISMGLMLLIFATGNYGFFNLLTLVLLVALLDDDHLLWMGRRLRRQPEPPVHRDPRTTPLATRPPFAPWAWVLALLFAYAGLAHMSSGLGGQSFWSQPGTAFANSTARFGLLGRYGLFATMTDGAAPEAQHSCVDRQTGDACQFEVLGTERTGLCARRRGQRRCEPVGGRLELVIEGSQDGKDWQPYRLPYPPNDLHLAPAQIAPHMPRLDWLMWFAALNPVDRPPRWFQHLMLALLEARPPVLELFEETPFGRQRPRFLRVQAHEYRFTRGWEGTYWQRRPRGRWLGPLQLENTP